MTEQSIQSLPGFPEFFPERQARRSYIVSAWREVARRYGFVEYDAPTLEPAALYEKKNSGGEILGQLYRFTDRGGRDVALRPEMTPSLARMAAARAPGARKPMKWFSIGSFFRYERQQKGRLREFLQFNCDLLGDDSPAADAEVVALTIDSLRAFGLHETDFCLRLSDRRPWIRFLEERGIDLSLAPEFLGVIDKMERDGDAVFAEKLAPFGLSPAEIHEFLQRDGVESFGPLLAELDARGMGAYASVDLSIVRGLAYYTGVVFEVFDRRGEFRAIAGGGRYDDLVAALSDGACPLACIGMGMGDAVLDAFIDSVPSATALRDASLALASPVEIFVVLASPSRRGEALRVVQMLRDLGARVDFAVSPAKVGKQFASAEALGAAHAVVVGDEWPLVRIKHMTDRAEIEHHSDDLAGWWSGRRAGSPAQSTR